MNAPETRFRTHLPGFLHFEFSQIEEGVRRQESGAISGGLNPPLIEDHQFSIWLRA